MIIEKITYKIPHKISANTKSLLPDPKGYSFYLGLARLFDEESSARNLYQMACIRAPEVSNISLRDWKKALEMAYVKGYVEKNIKQYESD